MRALIDKARLGGLVADSFPEIPIAGVTCDSRLVDHGMCFVAVPGTEHDGHNFVTQAVNRGASAVVVEHAAPLPASIPQIIVKDAREALARLASALYGLADRQQCGDLTVCGITGTNGKSTSCFLLHHLLKEAGYQAAMLGTIHYDLIGETLDAPLTTPDSISLSRMLVRAAGYGASHAVMEVSSHALDQQRCAGIEFQVAVFTNLSGDHLDYHLDLDSYLKAKKRLFDGLDRSAAAVVNVDDPVSDQMVADTKARVMRFGLGPRTQVTAEIRELTDRGCVFDMWVLGKTYRVNLPLIGRYNVANALAATAAAHCLGLSIDSVVEGLESAPQILGRLQRAELPETPFSVFVDYAHTDDALQNVLSALRPVTDGRLWCIFGCGGDRDRAKRPRMAAVAEKWADTVVVTSDNPRSEEPEAIVDDVLAGFSPQAHDRVVVQVDRRQAIEYALDRAEPNDVILVAGKGHETYQLVGGRRLDFNDVQVVREHLSHRMEAHV